MRTSRLSLKQIASNELTLVLMSSPYFFRRDDSAHARISVTLLRQADLKVQR